jgi:hypothetical protein
MRKAGHIAETKEKRNAYKILIGGNLGESEDLLNPGLHGSIVL